MNEDIEKHGKCSSGKNRYLDENTALKAAKYSMLRNAPHLDVYFCLLCYGYHLTSSKIKKKK